MNVAHINTPAPVATLDVLDPWLQKYDAVLAEMAKASADNKFKDELATIEQWFKVLSEPERTASVYTLLQHSTQDQMRFFVALLNQMIKHEEPAENVDATKPKNPKIALRPQSLNIPLPCPSAVPTPLITSRLQDPAAVPPEDSNRLHIQKYLSSRTPTSPLPSQDVPLRTPGLDKSWASMVNTPLVPMFQKQGPSRSDAQGSVGNGSGVFSPANVGNKGPGLAAVSPTTLNLLATSGLSHDAQLLAVQLVMSGILQPADITASTTSKRNQGPPPQSAGKNHKKGSQGTWRTPSNLKNPSSSLKSAPQRSSGPKSTISRNGGPDNTSKESLQVEDFDPEMLKDIPAWLRSLRLHKYTACFEGMTWEGMVILDDTMLEMKGVAALGARRRLLRAFDRVRRESTISTNTPEISSPSSSVQGPAPIVPQSATQSTRLSMDSPVFKPTGKAVAPASVVPTTV